MGVFQNNLMGAAAAASAGGGDFYSHQIANSTRYNQSASAHMYRTNGTPTNADKCTMSAWVKRTKLGSHTAFTGAYDSAGWGGGYLTIGMENGDNFKFLHHPDSNAGTQGQITSDALYRDSSAFYHVVVAYDSSQGTAANRVKIYINGSQLTDITATTYPDQNQDFILNKSGCKIFIGSGGDSGGNAYQPWDGYIAEYVMIDGTAYAASDFGESKNGVWIPKDASGLTFGNNGFYLKYESSSDLGNDSSGNNNDYTVSNISAHDQMLDSPTFNSSSNGGNFATYNPLNAGSYATLSEGNLKVLGNTSSDIAMPSGTFAMTSGKWYFERLIANESSGYPYLGLAAIGNVAYNTNTGGDIWAMRFAPASGTVAANGTAANVAGFGTITATSTGLATATTGDIIGFHLDLDNRKCWITKNGAFVNSGDPSAGTNPQWSWTATPNNPISFIDQIYNGTGSILNAGQDGTFAGNKTAQGNSDDTGYGNFYYAPDTGFLAMCSGNLPTNTSISPAETNDNYPQKLFNPLIWTGDGTTSRAITGLGFQPDWLWFKNRSNAYSHRLYDTSRGIASNGGKRIFANTNVVELDQTSGQDISAVGSDGFTTGASSQLYNNDTENGGLQVGWFWRANGGTTSSGSGDLTSTHQVDPSGGFSIVKAVGDGGSGDKTVSHGLSAAPTCILAKNRNTAYNWDTYWAEGVTSGSGMRLNTTDAPLTGRWGTINSSIMTCKENYTWVGTDNYIYYCFTNIEGYIKAGSYVGNGQSTDNAFVFTGFRPAFVLTKGIRSGDGWNIHDNATSPSNVADTVLQPNTSSTDLSNYNIDILSNGFKVRDGDGDLGSSGVTYVYLAFAKNPFQFATAR